MDDKEKRRFDIINDIRRMNCVIQRTDSKFLRADYQKAIRRKQRELRRLQ